MNRFIHITRAESVAVQITRYTGRGRLTRSYWPGLRSQGRLTTAIQQAPAIVEVKNNIVYVTLSK